jgi:CubicO group peptidase (beta-lactamase class C family)
MASSNAPGYRRTPTWLLSQAAVAAICATVLWSCADSGAVTAPYPEAENQNLDGQALLAATARMSGVDGMRGFLVARNGVLVVEEYFNGVGPGHVSDIFSVTKSVTSSLIGIAIAEGFIEDTEETLADHLLPGVVGSLEPGKAAITIGDLLQMAGGFEWAQGVRGPDFGLWWSSNDHVQFVLDRPLVDPPGSRFSYSDGMAHLLSVILTEATGSTANAFAAEHLFGPLGIGPRTWLSGNRGYNFGGVRLHLTLRDMWAFGELYLNGGSVSGRQVVPADWVTRSTVRQIATDGLTPFGPEYGYLWWIGSGAPYDFYFANGYGGQFIVVVPEARLVVVTQCDAVSQSISNARWYEILSTIVQQVIPAAR